MTITASESNKQQAPTKDRQPFVTKFSAMKAEAIKYYPAWQDLSSYENPTRGFFYNKAPNDGVKIDHAKVLDGHARRCVRDAASGMVSGLTSPSRPWFKLGLPDPELEQYEPVKLYLDECRKRMLEVAAKSNVYDCFHTGYEEIFTFGTSAFILLEDFVDVVRGRSFTIGEYFLSIGPDGRVNGFGRSYWMTIAALIKEFGYESCSPQVQTNYKNNQTQLWVRINHLIEENDDRIPSYSDFKNMPYRSVQWEDGSQDDTYLRFHGFEEFPVIASRWGTTTTADIYGRGPGWDALGDVKMLQQMQKNKLIALDKIVDPPLQQDASVVGKANVLPGGITTFSALLPNAGLKPAYQVQIDLNHLELTIEKTKAAISNAFYSDLFRMLIDQEDRPANVTATEIAEKKAEQLVMLSPVVEKLNNEQNNPFINRIYMLMNRAGMLPPPPPEIQGMELRVTYISTLAQAAKMVGIGAIQQTIGFVDSQLTIDASAGDILNRDEANREYSEMTGVPAKMINSPEKMQQIRDERAKQQEIAAKQQQLLLAAEAAAKGGKAVKDMAGAEMGKGNALDKFLATNVPGGGQ